MKDNLSTNKNLTDAFNDVYPCGHSNLRVNLFEAGGVKRFIAKSAGSRIWDVEGKEYIDFLNGIGPNILGNNHPEFVESLRNSLSEMQPVIGTGSLFSAADVELGQKLVQHIPCADKIKLCITGNDAVQMVIRLARAYTGRKRFIRFGGAYHGWSDNTLGGCMNPEPEGRPFALEGVDEDLYFTHGKAPGAAEESFMLPFNNIEVLEETLRQYGDEVALIHFEPIMTNSCCMEADTEFLKRVRELCDQYGILMCFDEVISGFRLALGGAQEYLGVVPDLATYGKALGNGIPISAIAGKQHIMEKFTDGTVLSPGTHMGYPLGIHAALTTVKILERDNGAIYQQIGRSTDMMMNGLKEIIKRRDLKVRVQGNRGVFYTVFGIDPETKIRKYEDLYEWDLMQANAFYKAMMQAGVVMLIEGRWFVSAAITDADISKTLEIVDNVLSKPLG